MNLTGDLNPPSLQDSHRKVVLPWRSLGLSSQPHTSCFTFRGPFEIPVRK